MKHSIILLLFLLLHQFILSQIKTERADTGLVLIENRYSVLLLPFNSIKEFELKGVRHNVGFWAKEFEELVCKEPASFNEIKKFRKKTVITNTTGIICLGSAIFMISGFYPKTDDNGDKIKPNKTNQYIVIGSFFVSFTATIAISNSKIRNIKKAAGEYELSVNESYRY